MPLPSNRDQSQLEGMKAVAIVGLAAGPAVAGEAGEVAAGSAVAEAGEVPAGSAVAREAEQYVFWLKRGTCA